MTADYEGETHPLDRDYSVPVEPRKPTAVEYHPGLRRVGLITFVAGFVTVFVAAIVLGNSRGAGTIETVGSFLHRSAMVVILIGGSLIILAYQLPRQRARTRVTRPTTQRSDFRSFSWLVLWNVVGFFAILFVTSLSRSMVQPTLYVLVNGAMTITCALMVTIAVWHHGLLRAYAIGVLVALLVNNYSGFIVLMGGYMAAGGRLMFVGYLATIQISGLTCAGYVGLMKRAGSWRASGVNRDRT